VCGLRCPLQARGDQVRPIVVGSGLLEMYQRSAGRRRGGCGLRGSLSPLRWYSDVQARQPGTHWDVVRCQPFTHTYTRVGLQPSPLVQIQSLHCQVVVMAATGAGATLAVAVAVLVGVKIHRRRRALQSGGGPGGEGGNVDPHTAGMPYYHNLLLRPHTHVGPCSGSCEDGWAAFVLVLAALQHVPARTSVA
jgi:hypothetical protein